MPLLLSWHLTELSSVAGNPAESSDAEYQLAVNCFFVRIVRHFNLSCQLYLLILIVSDRCENNGIYQTVSYAGSILQTPFS